MLTSPNLRSKYKFLSFIVLIGILVILAACSAVSLPVRVPAAPGEPGTPTQPTATPFPVLDFEQIQPVLRMLVENASVPANLPADWLVHPCDGSAAFWCVTLGQDSGSVELLGFPLQTMTEFGAILSTLGLTPTAIDISNDVYQQQAVIALQRFVDDQHAAIREDRQISYGDSARFDPMPTQTIRFGGLPGLRYGFTLTDSNGKVVERVVSYVAFDGTAVYTIGTTYFPAAEWSFSSDEALVAFLPYLDQLVAGLPLDQVLAN